MFRCLAAIASVGIGDDVKNTTATMQSVVAWTCIYIRVLGCWYSDVVSGDNRNIVKCGGFVCQWALCHMAELDSMLALYAECGGLVRWVAPTDVSLALRAISGTCDLERKWPWRPFCSARSISRKNASFVKPKCASTSGPRCSYDNVTLVQHARDDISYLVRLAPHDSISPVLCETVERRCLRYESIRTMRLSYRRARTRRCL